MKRKVNIKLLLAVVLLGLTLMGFKEVQQSNLKLDFQRIELKSTQSELKKLESEYDWFLNNACKKPKDAQSCVQHLQELEKKKQDLEKQLSLKRQREAENRRQAVYAAGLPTNCADILAQAGVSDPVNASILIHKESGCNPYAVNASSGACGIAQELPCGKSGCRLGDGVCQVKWMQSYVMGRYGSWANAVYFHINNNWY